MNAFHKVVKCKVLMMCVLIYNIFFPNNLESLTPSLSYNYIHIKRACFHCCNHFHNILRLLDVLTDFPFTTSETMGDYHLSA